MKTLILLAAIASIVTGPVVEGCGFLPRPASFLCLKNDGRR